MIFKTKIARVTYYSRANGFFIQADALGSAVHEAATSAVERPSHTTCPGDEHSTTHHGFKVLICSKHIVPPPFFILRVPSVFPEDIRIIPLFTYCVNRFIKVFYSRISIQGMHPRACTQGCNSKDAFCEAKNSQTAANGSAEGTSDAHSADGSLPV